MMRNVFIHLGFLKKLTWVAMLLTIAAPLLYPLLPFPFFALLVFVLAGVWLSWAAHTVSTIEAIVLAQADLAGRVGGEEERAAVDAEEEVLTWDGRS